MINTQNEFLPGSLWVLNIPKDRHFYQELNGRIARINKNPNVSYYDVDTTIVDDCPNWTFFRCNKDWLEPFVGKDTFTCSIDDEAFED